MPIVTQIVCDGCQTIKKDTNHWYMLTIDQQTATMTPLKSPSDGQPTPGPGAYRQFFCGRYCAVEAITRWMDHVANPRKRVDVVPLDLEELLPHSEPRLTFKRS